MNKVVLGVGLAIAAPLLGFLAANMDRKPQQIASPLIGKKAPPFTALDLSTGNTVTLASHQGKPLVLNFWASWCVPCYEEHGTLVRGAAQNPDTTFLGIVYEDEPERIAQFLKERGTSYPSLSDPDGRAAVAYGVYGVPETFFIDRTGTIVNKFVGPLDPASLSSNLAAARR